MAIRILIAAHTFPPFPGIGGRRWAKFAKSLTKKNIEVSVVSANLDKSKQSFWTKDVQGLSHTTYHHKYPSILGEIPRSINEKLLYRWALYRMKSISSGTPYDRALLDKAEFLKAMRHEIERFNPTHICVTAAPFQLLVYTLELIEEYQQIKFLADLRDPWTWGESYGYSSLDKERLHKEKEWESEVCDKFHWVTSPWPQVVSKLKEDYPNSEANIQLLPQSFDPDDLPAVTGTRISSSSKVIAYGGNLYQGLELSLKELGRLGHETKKYHVQVYTDKMSRKEELPGVEILEPLPTKDFFEALNKADALLFPIGKAIKHGIPTKLFEFAALRKPIFAFGHKGELAKLIVENELGIFLDSPKQVLTYIDNLDSKNGIWYKQFELGNVTDQLIEMLK